KLGFDHSQAQSTKGDKGGNRTRSSKFLNDLIERVVRLNPDDKSRDLWDQLLNNREYANTDNVVLTRGAGAIQWRESDTGKNDRLLYSSFEAIVSAIRRKHGRLKPWR